MLTKSSSINKTRASLVNLVFNYASAFIQIFNSLLLIPIYLRFFSFEDYGTWLAASALLQFFIMIDPGLSSISTQRLSKAYSDDNDREFRDMAFSSVCIGVFFGVLTIFFGFIYINYASSLILNIENVPLINYALVISVIAFALVPVNAVMASFLQALLQTYQLNIILIISILLCPISILFSLYLGYGVVSLPIGLLMTNIFTFIALVLYISYMWPRFLKVRFFELPAKFTELLKNLFSDLKYLYIKKVSSILSENMEVTISGIFFTPAIAAIIGILKRLIGAVILFSNSVSVSVYSSLTHSFQDNQGIKENITKSLYATDSIQAILTTSLFILILPFSYIWLGRALDLGYSFILMMGFASFLSCKSNFIFTSLTAMGKFKDTSIIYIYESIARLALSYLAIYFFGLYGIPMAAIASVSLSLVLLSFILNKTVAIPRGKILNTFSAYEVIIYILFSISGWFVVFPNSSSDFLLPISLTICFFGSLLFASKLRKFIKSIILSI